MKEGKPTDPIDNVRRALIAADCKVVAERTQMPETIVMALAQSNGWDVARAEAVIEETMQEVAQSIKESSELAMFVGGGPGGGKSLYARDAVDELRYRIANYGAEVVDRRRLGVVTTCVS
jgi:hypothetical protein